MPQVASTTLMRPTSTSRENGVISIGPSIRMATWLAQCGAEKRDMEAAKRFFKQAVDVVGHAPERVTTDGHDSYPRAIRETLGNDVSTGPIAISTIDWSRDHRGIKQRDSPMRGFGSVASASCFCRAFDARAPVLPGPDYYEATDFPCPATRGVPPTIGSAFGHGAGGLTQKDGEPEVSNTFC